MKEKKENQKDPGDEDKEKESSDSKIDTKSDTEKKAKDSSFTGKKGMNIGKAGIKKKVPSWEKELKSNLTKKL